MRLAGDRFSSLTRTEGESVQRLLRLLATAGAALMLVVIVASASLRLSQAGLSCADWPACYGRIEANAPPSTGTQIARLAHRLAAGTVGIVLLAALLIGAAQRPRLTRQIAIASSALAVALFLAAVGARFPATGVELPSPAVMVANLGGGFALLVLLWWLRLSALGGRPLLEEAPVWARLVGALALLATIGEIVLGGLVSAKFAALACPGFPGCGVDWPPGALFESLDPFAQRAVDPSGAILRPPALAALHWAHRVCGLVVTALAATLVVALLRSHPHARHCAAVIVALLVVQLALGAAMVHTDFPLALALAHNASAALLLTALVAGNRSLYLDDSGR